MNSLEGHILSWLEENTIISSHIELQSGIIRFIQRLMKAEVDRIRMERKETMKGIIMKPDSDPATILFQGSVN